MTVHLAPFGLCAVAAVTLAFTSTAWAQGADNPDSVPPSVVVSAGKPVKIAVLNNLKKDCSPGAAPILRVPGLPQHGQVIGRTANIATGKRNRCPDKQASGQIVIYQSKPNYAGPDQVSIEVETAEGEVRKATIAITVTGTGLPAGQQKL